MKNTTELKPSDILGMVKDVFEHDASPEHYGKKSQLLHYHFICNQLITNHANCLLYTEKFPFFKDYWYKDKKPKGKLIKLLDSTKYLLYDNKPSETVFPEFYNHPAYRQNSELAESWWKSRFDDATWDMRLNNGIGGPTSKIALTQRINYLNALISKLKENGQ